MFIWLYYKVWNNYTVSCPNVSDLEERIIEVNGMKILKNIQQYPYSYY